MSKRTGKSLVHTIKDVPVPEMIKLGLTNEQAERIKRVRNVLPVMGDSKSPNIDARKLWERIGKPHGQFNKWAEHYIKPMLERPKPFGEISPKVSQGTTGRPRQDYTLSRDLAAHLAMQANTPEGEEIRSYFLDMERLAIRLSEHQSIRVDAIIVTDNKMTHTLRKRVGDQVKAGMIRKAEAHNTATERERRLKRTVCEVLTGRPTDYWRTAFGKGVRDVLDTGDLLLYGQCLESASVLIKASINKDERLREILSATYGGKVDPNKYAPQMVAA